MRFAVMTRPEHLSWIQIRDLWVAAERPHPPITIGGRGSPDLLGPLAERLAPLAGGEAGA